MDRTLKQKGLAMAVSRAVLVALASCLLLGTFAGMTSKIFGPCPFCTAFCRVYTYVTVVLPLHVLAAHSSGTRHTPATPLDEPATLGGTSDGVCLPGLSHQALPGWRSGELGEQHSGRETMTCNGSDLTPGLCSLLETADQGSPGHAQRCL